MKPKKINLNFTELVHLIDIYSLNLNEDEKLFNSTVKDSNNLLLKTATVLDKLKPIHDKILSLNCIQNEIKIQIECIRYNEALIEELINNLEKNFAKPKCKKFEITDLYRQNTYKLTEYVGSSLDNIQDVMDHVNEYISRNSYGGDIEKVAQILQVQLQQLEEIEIKTQKLRDHLNEAEFYKNRCLRNYKLKNAKIDVI